MIRLNQSVAGRAGMGHAERTEKPFLQHRIVRLAGNLLDRLGGRVEGDILVAPAGADGADLRQFPELLADLAGILPVFEPIVIRIAPQPQSVRERIAKRRGELGVVREPQRGGILRDRRVERQFAFRIELGGHGSGHALGHRRPAENGVDVDRVALVDLGLAIALEECDFAIDDDAHRHRDHRIMLVHEPMEPGIHRNEIDALALGRVDGSQRSANDCAAFLLFHNRRFGTQHPRSANDACEQQERKCQVHYS